MKKLNLLLICFLIGVAASAQKKNPTKGNQLKGTDLFALINAFMPDASSTEALPGWNILNTAKNIRWQSLKPEYDKISKQWQRWGIVTVKVKAKNEGGKAIWNDYKFSVSAYGNATNYSHVEISPELLGEGEFLEMFTADVYSVLDENVVKYKKIKTCKNAWAETFSEVELPGKKKTWVHLANSWGAEAGSYYEMKWYFNEKDMQLECEMGDDLADSDNTNSTDNNNASSSENASSFVYFFGDNKTVDINEAAGIKAGARVKDSAGIITSIICKFINTATKDTLLIAAKDKAGFTIGQHSFSADGVLVFFYQLNDGKTKYMKSMNGSTITEGNSFTITKLDSRMGGIVEGSFAFTAVPLIKNNLVVQGQGFAKITNGQFRLTVNEEFFPPKKKK